MVKPELNKFVNDKNVKHWNARDLKKILKELHSSIYELECYDTSDLYNYELVASELIDRGYVINESVKLVITR